MRRGQLLNRIAHRGSVKTAGACMAMAMAVSRSGVAAFSTTTGGALPAISATPALLSSPSPSSMSSNSLYHSVHILSRTSHQRFFATSRNTDSNCGCDDMPRPQGDNEDLLETNIGSVLKDTVLTNTEGSPVKLGSYIGSEDGDATIVVFLRHLA